MKRRIAIALLFCTMLVATLTGCKSKATFTNAFGDAKAEFTELDDSVDGDFELPYTNIAFDVELESGTVDIEVIDLEVIPLGDDEHDYAEIDTIFEAKDLASGDHKGFTDNDGIVRIRITGHDGATGTITFSEG